MVNFRARKQDVDRAHAHQYDQDPQRPGYARCTRCAFVLPKALLTTYSIPDARLSPGLQAERRRS